jgi:hypothetical protein
MGLQKAHAGLDGPRLARERLRHSLAACDGAGNDINGGVSLASAPSAT